MPYVSSADSRRLYEIAEAQAGYFTTAQAQTAGFSPPTLAYHVKHGRFLHSWHGVYRLAQFPHTPFEDLYAAWLTAGPAAVISHESALALYGLSDNLPSAVHLIVPRTASRRHPGLRLHTHHLKPAEITRREGLPLTTVPRTLADVAAGGLAEELVGQAIHEALQRGLAAPEALRHYAHQRGGRGAHLILKALALVEAK